MTSNPAGELVELFRPFVPASWTLEPYAIMPDNIEPGCPVVLVYRRRMRPGPTLGLHTNEMELWILDEHEDEREADDSLSQRLDEVVVPMLDALAIDWPEGAERGIFGSKYHAYSIPFVIHSERSR